MIVITLEGGIIQDISTDDPAEVGRQVTVIDYDCEGCDPDEVERVPQGKGKTEDATICKHVIGVLDAPVAQFLKARE